MLKINWMEGYNNLPHFLLEEDLHLMPWEECEFKFKDGMWWHVQANGLVRYFTHPGDDFNAGGFHGEIINIMYNGKPKAIRGPWSSRASYLNTLLKPNEQVAEVILNNGKTINVHVGILISELIDRWSSTEAYLLRTVEERENGSYTASLANNCILKPDGMRIDKGNKYEVVVEPVHVVTN